MMMMKSPVILAACVLLLSALTVHASESSFGPDACCFKYISNALAKNRVVSYEFTNRLCPKKAVVLTMRNGKGYCTNPSEPWVMDIIAAKDKVKA